jgi:hypothetical protein
LSLLSPACGERAKPASSQETILWRAVGSWSGRGNGQTGSFSVETGALRVRWDARNPGAGQPFFKLWLHSAISGRPLQAVVDHQGPGGDVAYIEDEPRVSYFVVQSENLDWTLTLEEATPATGERTGK